MDYHIRLRMHVLPCMTLLYDSPHQFAGLMVSFSGWTREYVLRYLQVRLYCSARVNFPSGTSRTYWATDSRYPYFGGARRDFVEVDYGEGQIAMAQLIAFVHLHSLPPGESDAQKKIVLIRWLTVSPGFEDGDRPMCEYPLSSNHCLWTWSKVRTRVCFSMRGFNRSIPRLTSHWPQVNPMEILQSENRAHYDLINFGSIIRHANIAPDPTTGHMLQSIQII